MKKQIFTLTALLSLVLTACQNAPTPASDTVIENKIETPSTSYNYTVAQNYYVKNTVSGLENPKIETLEQFDSIFGMAPLVGEAGLPTEIDFSTHYVIAQILPETTFATTIKPINLGLSESGELNLTYRIEVGGEQGFSIVPFFAIIVDKKIDGPLTLIESK